MIQIFTSLFPSNFKSVFVWHLIGVILRFEFHPKAVFCSESLRFRGSPLFTFKTDRLDFRWLDRGQDHVKDSLTLIEMRAHGLHFLNQRVFDVILSSIQLSQDIKVSNGGPLIRKISAKINRCLSKMAT